MTWRTAAGTAAVLVVHHAATAVPPAAYLAWVRGGTRAGAQTA